MDSDDTGAATPLFGRAEGPGVEDMLHDGNRDLVRYWNTLRGSRPCPARAEVDPRRISRGISNVFILEDLGRGNLRFRLAGSALVDAFWMELRGLPVQAIMAATARESMRELVAETLAEPGIGMARLSRHGARVPAFWEMALLPLRSDRGDINRVLGALHPLAGTEPRPKDPPLVFGIEEMTISPITLAPETAVTDFAQRGIAPSGASGASGFAEAGASWQPAPGSGAGEQPTAAPHLRSIDGGRGTNRFGDAEAEEATRRRASLRIVTTDTE
ncbi:MAG: PAS domain-containing protein [Pseudomonadota bacterium]